MKKYIQPAIKLRSLEAETLMAAVSLNNEVGDGKQLSKGNIWEDDEEDF
ncbi:MAG: hypothetical protein IJ539_03440 [Prevotella sp.]|nr:hypothetical protein [Prevotella sp.]